MALQEQKLSHRRRARRPAAASSGTLASFEQESSQAQRTGESWHLKILTNLDT